MTENNSNTETNKYLFINLVTMLSMSAMQQLGKLVNPAEGKAAINLDAAQATIDALDMLAAKTKGNLDNDEARMMSDTLSMLKMNFVETKESQKAEGRSQKSEVRSQEEEGEKAQRDGEKQSRPESPAQEKTEPSGPKPGAEQGNDPKFHKSYD